MAFYYGFSFELLICVWRCVQSQCFFEVEYISFFYLAEKPRKISILIRAGFSILVDEIL